MFDTIAGAANLGAPYSQPLDPLRAFFDQHREGLLNAAALLGGRRGARLVQTVIDSFADQAAPPRRVMHAVSQLHDLLSLKNVHDPERDEAAHFAAIDPADACVAEICLLADGLNDAIDGYLRSSMRRAAA